MPNAADQADAPVVLLHGSPTCGALWSGLRAQVERRTFAPDLPGHGAEPPLPLGNHSVDDHLAWLEQSRQRQRLPSWPELHVVGTDYGALLGGELAVRFGVRSLSVVSGALGIGWAPAKMTALPGLRLAFYRTFAGRRWMNLAAGPAHRQSFLDAVGGALEDPGLARRMEATALGISLRSTARLPVRIRRTRIPTLLVWGADDANYPLRQARLLSLAMGAPLAVVPDAGHALPFERPAALARVLQPFWRQTGSAS